MWELHIPNVLHILRLSMDVHTIPDKFKTIFKFVQFNFSYGNSNSYD
jgi:hypothetical protein